MSAQRTILLAFTTGAAVGITASAAWPARAQTVPSVKCESASGWSGAAGVQTKLAGLLSGGNTNLISVSVGEAKSFICSW